MKATCPVHGCGKRFITPEHAKSHADIAHPGWIEERNKRKGWVTPYGFADFAYPVTYEEACEQTKAIRDQMYRSTKEAQQP